MSINVANTERKFNFVWCFRYIRIDKEDLKAQVGLAATSCRLTETMLRCGHSLWTVPSHLLKQLRQLNDQEKYKHKENNKPVSLSFLKILIA